MSKIVTYTQARDNLKTYLDYVTQNHDIVFITRQNGEEVVMISKADYESMDETSYLLASKPNKENLLESIKEIDEGKTVQFESIDALKKHYGV